MKSLLLLLPLLLAAAPAARAAAAPAGARKGVKACRADIERFCPTMEPGEGRVGACLKERRAQLSKKCKSWLAHGGQGHEDAAFQELDKPVNTPGRAGEQPGVPSAAPSAPSPAQGPGVPPR